MKLVRMKIFLAEDNPGDIRLVQEAISECNAQVTLETAIDGEEALNYLKSFTIKSDQVLPDMIILDWNMPRKSGKELLQYIRSFDQFDFIPVVVMSSSNAENDIRTAYELEANCYITKPVEYERFIYVIHSITSYWSLFNSEGNSKT